MNRILYTTIILALFLSSCSLTGESKPPASATPAPDDISTQVMLLLTQAPLVIPQIPPTATLEPTLQETPTETPSDPNVTQTLTVTEAPSPTPTLNLSDPKSTLGNPTWQEKFDRDKTGFFLFDDDHTRITLSDGNLNLTSLNSNGWHGWSMNSPKPRNFYLEATFRTETCAELDRYGLVFRAPNFDTGYFFGVSCDGKYNFRVYDQKGDIISWAQDGAILAGSDQTNRLGVMAEDNRIKLYANGTLLKELTDSTYTSDGLFGVFIAAQRTPGFTVKVDEIAYWTRP